MGARVWRGCRPRFTPAIAEILISNLEYINYNTEITLLLEEVSTYKKEASAVDATIERRRYCHCNKMSIMKQQLGSILFINASVLLVLWSRLASSDQTKPAGADRENLLNHTGCLYAYVDPERSTYLFKMPDRAEPMNGTLSKVNYSGGQQCVADGTPGHLNMKFDINDNNMISLTLNFQIKTLPHQGYWEIDEAKMTLEGRSESMWAGFDVTDMPMKVLDMYATQGYSFSCSSLVLDNINQQKEKGKPHQMSPHFRVTLNRFQVQPFQESPTTVFAPSFDCTVWLTLPVIMGFILVLFITFTVLIGVSLLMDQGNQTSDLRFSKQGGMLMNQAQLDATK